MLASNVVLMVHRQSHVPVRPSTRRTSPQDGRSRIDLPPDNDPLEELDRKTWVRKKCPLCDGKGRILQPGVLQP